MNLMSNLPQFSSSPLFDQDKLSSIDPLENQLCRVCDEPAAGFHFGAFTCEGCKSFFGRSCNNQTVIQECKNSYRCVVDKKNRTACKACRLRKCLMVGMSKSGCRYGRRSNWFKIHCLMQKNAPRLGSLPYPSVQPPTAHGRAHPLTLAEQLIAFSSGGGGGRGRRPHKMESSRSPSPLNTSTEAVSVISSSDQSSPSPILVKAERAVSPPLSLFPPPPTIPDGCNPFALLGSPGSAHSQRNLLNSEQDHVGRRSPLSLAGGRNILHSSFRASSPTSSASSPPNTILATNKLPSPLSVNCTYDTTPDLPAGGGGVSVGQLFSGGGLLPNLLLDPAALYRLSPLLAMHPLLLASTASSPLFRHQMTDFRQQLDLLAERRAIFERLKAAEAEGSPRAASVSPPPTSAGGQPEIPIDLSCK